MSDALNDELAEFKNREEKERRAVQARLTLRVPRDKLRDYRDRRHNEGTAEYYEPEVV